MKIIIIGPAYPLRGGIADFNELLCSNLIKQGNDTSIVSFSLQYPNLLFPGKTQYREKGAIPPKFKINTIINSVNPISWLKTALYINNQKPDLIIVRYWLPFMAMSLGWILKLLNRKSTNIIAITDNVIPHEKRIGDTFLSKFFLSKCDGFITLSKSVTKDLKKFNIKKKIKTLQHPIYNQFGDKVKKNEAKQYLKLDTTKNYILFFGFIRAYKGLDLLLEAYAISQLKKQGVQLIVAGEFYDNRIPYIEMVQKLELVDDVIFKSNYITNEDVKYYFSACDLVTQPYITATQSGITQIAYHFDTPLLVTNVGGLGEIVIDNKSGYVCDVNSDNIAEKLNAFYTKNKEIGFVENIKELKKKFSWEVFVNQVIDLYSSLKYTQTD